MESPKLWDTRKREKKRKSMLAKPNVGPEQRVLHEDKKRIKELWDKKTNAKIRV